MGWPEDNKIKRLQHEASEHNKEAIKEVLHSESYREKQNRRLKYHKTPEEDYLTGFGGMI